ncbi:MAG: branched-chain amino acid transaminase [Acidimicrobiia bacterium]|nr:branched-chain amino acid transaminase [Acidimicrobiia bacterium]
MDNAQFIWMDGEMVPWADAQVHALSHGLHYGTGVFEGIRAYATATGPAVFRLTEHMQRLHRSAAAYDIPVGWSVEHLVEAAREVVKVNSLPSAYIRPLVTYGAGSLSLDPGACEPVTIIAAWTWGAYLGEDGVRNGISVGVSSWRRFAESTLIPNAKGTGGYLNSVLAKREALRAGFDEAIMLNTAGLVAEGSGENLFLVRDGVVMTPAVSAGILDGITRASVIQLLQDDGVEVREASLVRSDLYYADELFFTGTAAEVTPIREVDHRPVGNGRPGPITQRAQDLFHEAVSGKLDAYLNWLEPV